MRRKPDLQHRAGRQVSRDCRREGRRCLGRYTITATAGAGGSISPAGATTVACGGSQTYTIAPDDKCHVIADVKVDGVSVGAVASYTFSDVQTNHSIDATFTLLGPYTI